MLHCLQPEKAFKLLGRTGRKVRVQGYTSQLLSLYVEAVLHDCQLSNYGGFQQQLMYNMAWILVATNVSRDVLIAVSRDLQTC